MSDFDCLSLTITDTIQYFGLAVYNKGKGFIRNHVYSLISGISIYFLLFWLFPDIIHTILYWTVLGILSSIGLGSGLHTFILYLAPHIVATTIDFPDENLFQIYQRVLLPAIYWGIGTAIGELPPYLLAKGATYDYKNIPAILSNSLLLSNMLRRYSFLTILAFASFPNPLFDLAGVLSGYIQIPFLTFFSAVLIGKAFIKAQGQTLFIIYTARLVKDNVKEYLISTPSSGVMYYVSVCWQVLLFCLFTYFLLSIMRKTARSYFIETLTRKKEF